MSQILTEAQLLERFGGPQPEGIAMTDLIRTMFSLREGSTTGTPAPPGEIGEEVEDEIPVESALTLVTNTPKTVAEIELTPGEWRVSGVVSYKPAATTSITFLGQSISDTDNTMGAAKNGKQQTMTAIVSGGVEFTLDTPPVKLTVTETDTYYLVAHAKFTVDVLEVYGTINARRVR